MILKEAFRSKALQMFIDRIKKSPDYDKYADTLGRFNIQWDKLTDNDVKLFIYKGGDAETGKMLIDPNTNAYLNIDFRKFINDNYIMIWTPATSKEFYKWVYPRSRYARTYKNTFVIKPGSLYITRGRKLLGTNFEVLEPWAKNRFIKNFKTLNTELFCNVVILNANVIEKFAKTRERYHKDDSNETISRRNYNRYKDLVKAIKIKGRISKLDRLVINYSKKLNEFISNITVTKEDPGYISNAIQTAQAYSQIDIKEYDSDQGVAIGKLMTFYNNFINAYIYYIEYTEQNYRRDYKSDFYSKYESEYRSRVFKYLKAIKSILSSGDLKTNIKMIDMMGLS